MKFIHCSDLHLDSKMVELSSEKRKIRREEILHTFEKLCYFAESEGVSAVIIAGDMFDTAKVSEKTAKRVFSAISDAKSVDFLYVSGNHDEQSFINKTENLPQNLKIFGDKWTTFAYQNVRICGAKITSANAPFIYDTLSLPKDTFNIVTLHGQVAGYKTTEKAEVISIPLFKDKNVDYLALGHIHTYSTGIIDARGKYAYSGTLDGRGFDELGEKGFILIDVDGARADYSFVEFCSRGIFEHNFNVEGYQNYIEAREQLLEQLKVAYDGKSLIKVVLTGAHKPDFEIDKEGLAEKLNQIFFFAKVYDKTELKIEIEDYIQDKSVRGEFVRAVWESNLSPEQKRKVILTGLSALKGEEF